MKVAFISCTKTKSLHACSAREMYQPSALFQKAVRYVEQCDYDAWFILSAKYGLLEPDTVIEPYDVSVNQLHTSARKTWSHSVLAQVMAFPTPISRIDFYAGRPYREQLMHDLELRGIPCQTPLQGKGIGEQLRYYALHTQDFHP